MSKLSLKLLVVFFLFTVSIYGQYLETTIYLPDSFSDIIYSQAFAYNDTDNKIYVGGYDGNCVIMIDGTTNNVITIITVGDGPLTFAWNPLQNRTYVANYIGSSISVIREGTAGIQKVSKNKRENRLFEIFSNPFESNIKIRYSVDKPSNVTVKIYNLSGRIVKSFTNSNKEVGIYEINWDGKDNYGKMLEMEFILFV